MKIFKSQTGFSPLHVLLVLVALGIVGFTGWRVYDAKNKTNKSLNDATKASEVVKQEKKETPKIKEYKIPDGFVEYENKELGFKFAYPKEWKTKPNVVYNTILWLNLNSSDYEELEGGYGGTAKGTEIKITVNDIAKLGDSYISNKDILAGDVNKLKESTSSAKEVDVNGRKGVEFVKAYYEGPKDLITKLEIDGKEYSFRLGENVNTASFTSNLEIYHKVVNTFVKS